MVEFVPAREFEQDIAVSVPDNYRKFRDGEGIPVHEGIAVRNVNDLETGYWERTGQNGAFINLYGAEGINDMHLQEIAPGGETDLQHQFYDQLVYVSQGRGLTRIGDGDDSTTFEWERNSLFSIPMGVPYKHVNASGDDSARLVATTPLPLVMNIIPNRDLVLEPDVNLGDSHFDSDFFSPEGELGAWVDHYDEGAADIAWSANFVPDLAKFDKLKEWGRLGAGSITYFPMEQTGMFAHVIEFEAGTYKKAHRHNPGANVVVLSGEGYSLMWREGMDERVVVEWEPGSIIVPPSRWWHHHFPVSRESIRQFAMHPPEIGSLRDNGDFDPHSEENTISYVDEDPAIRERYRAELATRGLESQMPEACYTDPDHELNQVS